MIEFKKREDNGSILDIAPLVDMVFLLLIFFLLTNSYQKHQVSVTLPATKSGQEVTETKKTYTIEIKPNGIILINGKTSTLNDIEKIPKTAEVDIAGDKNISYQTFMKVLDRLKEAGINNVNLLTLKE
ncbi:MULTISPECIES: ExbD/TolR family protein [unclassified Desulfurobacterium]|uniref:ExbD/TolR family protein n=1 Tax=Desulfurobacterium sp. TC5-1 TaxID=1158318 RepID=UPI0003B53940|nr:biopolymer transporter ExbD [Desulfurobacterium sp. TC5-1]